MDCDFVIDCGNFPSRTNINSENEGTLAPSERKISIPQDELKKLFADYKASLQQHEEVKKLEKKEKNDFEKFQEEMGWMGKQKFDFDLAGGIKNSASLKAPAVVIPAEKFERIPIIETSKREPVKSRRAEREKTKGPGWFGLSAPEMTPEVKNDLEVIQMRSILDPKRFYKKNDFKVLPKYFQIGKVMDSPLDYYSNRLTKKEQKKTLVEELMANAKVMQYSKKKYKEIILQKQKTNFKEFRKTTKLRNRKSKKNKTKNKQD